MGSGPSSDILSGLLGYAPDVLSGRLRIRHIVRRTFCQDWMDLHQTNCQDVYVDRAIFLVCLRPNFTISTKFHNFDQISQFRPKWPKNDPKCPKNVSKKIKRPQNASKCLKIS